MGRAALPFVVQLPRRRFRPAELVAEAARLGLAALAITDHDGMYGVPQFAQAAARLREQAGTGIGTIFGAELSLGLPPGSGGAPAAACPASPESWPSATPRTGVPDPGGRHLLVLARDPEGYRRLCQVISAAQLAGGEKGRPVYDLEALAQAHGGHWVILTGCRKGAVPAALASAGPEAAAAELAALAEMFGRDNVMVELTSHDQPADDERNDALYELATSTGTAVVATGNVHYATPRTPGWPRRWPRSGPAAAWTRWTAGWPPPAPRTSGRARRWPTGSAATPVWPSAPCGWPATARSTSR